MKNSMEKVEKMLSSTEEINIKDAKFRREIDELFEKGEIDEVRGKLQQYRQFLLKYHDKEDVERILEEYYKKLENLEKI